MRLDVPVAALLAAVFLTDHASAAETFPTRPLRIAVIDRLEKAIVEVSKNPVFREKLQAEGGDVVGSSAKEYGAYLEEQRDKWGKLFTRLGIKPE